MICITSGKPPEFEELGSPDMAVHYRHLEFRSRKSCLVACPDGIPKLAGFQAFKVITYQAALPGSSSVDGVPVLISDHLYHSAPD